MYRNSAALSFIQVPFSQKTIRRDGASRLANESSLVGVYPTLVTAQPFARRPFHTPSQTQKLEACIGQPPCQQ